MAAPEVASETMAEPIWPAMYLFGGASVFAGILDLIWGDFEAAHQPIGALGDHVPGQVFLAYLAAALLIVLAARMLSAMLLLFDVLVLVRLPLASPQNHVAWGANAYNLAAAGAVWIFAEFIVRRRYSPRYSGQQT